MRGRSFRVPWQTRERMFPRRTPSSTARACREDPDPRPGEVLVGAVHRADPVAESGDQNGHRARAGGPRGGGRATTPKAVALQICEATRAPPIPAAWGASEGSAGHRDRNCRSNRTPLRVRIRTELFHFGVALWAANFDRPCAVKIHMQVSLGIVAGGDLERRFSSGGSRSQAGAAVFRVTARVLCAPRYGGPYRPASNSLIRIPDLPHAPRRQGPARRSYRVYGRRSGPEHPPSSSARPRPAPASRQSSAGGCLCSAASVVVRANHPPAH